MSSTSSTAINPSTVPENFQMSVELTRPEFDYHLRLMAALKMFELGQISSGKAAELCGISRVDFFDACSRYQVSLFNYSAEEMEEELRSEVDAFQ